MFHLFIYKTALQYAARNNDIEVIYVLLLKEKVISNDLFKENTELKQIAIPSTITKIENGAFAKCSSLEQVSIPSSVTWIGKFAFYRCSSLKQISIPTTTSIDNKAFDYSSFNCLYSIANQFLTNLNLQKNALIIMNSISSLIPEKEIENMLEISSKFLFNENEIIRIISFKIIRQLIYQTSESNEFDDQISELIIKYSESLFKLERINDEFKKFIKILSDIFLYEYPITSELMCIIENIEQMIDNKEISIEIRICCFSLIEISSSMSIDLDLSLLSKAIQLATEACQNYRFDDNYLFCEPFLQKYALDILIPNDLFKQNIEKLSESKMLSDQQIALLLMKVSLEATSFDDCVNYIDLALKIGDCEDDTIIKRCIDFFCCFVDSPNESLVIKFDQISKFLLKNIKFDISLKVLSKLIKNIHRSPDYFKDIIDSFLLILKSIEKSKTTEVLKCINACFSSGSNLISPFDKPFEPAKKVFEIVSEGMNSKEFEAQIVLKIFGNLVFCSPEIIKNNLDKIMKFCIINLNNSYVSESIKCIRKIASYLPDSIFPFLPENIVSLDPYENIKGDKILFAYKFIQCLCQIGLGNEEFAKKYDELLWNSFNYIFNNDNYHLVFFDISIEFFAKRNFPIAQLLNSVLDSLIMVSSHSFLYYNLKSIQQMILFLPKEQIPDDDDDEFIRLIETTLISAGTGVYPNFFLSRSIPFIPCKIYRKLFDCLLAFADFYSVNWSGKIEKLIHNFSYELMNTSKLSCFLFLHFLTKILMNCRSELNNDKVLDHVMKTVSLCFQSIHKEKNIDTEKYAHFLMSLIYVLRIKEKSFCFPNENAISFIKSLNQIDSYNNFDFIVARQTLILNLVMVFELQIDGDVKKILNEIKLIKNMEVLPLLADCIIYIFKIVGNEILPLLKKFSSILFSSEKYILEIIDKDTLQFYSSLMSSLKQEELIFYTNLNEYSIHQITNNMKL